MELITKEIVKVTSEEFNHLAQAFDLIESVYTDCQNEELTGLTEELLRLLDRFETCYVEIED